MTSVLSKWVLMTLFEETIIEGWKRREEEKEEEIAEERMRRRKA